MVFVSPEANNYRREQGPEPGARAVRGDELVGGELRRDLPLCLSGRALGCLPDQAQRESGHCLSRGVAGEAEVAAVGIVSYLSSRFVDLEVDRERPGG